MNPVRVDALADGVVALTLDRPETRNALSIELCDALSEAFGELAADPGVRVVLLRGAGPVFCSGADFAAVSGPGALDFLPAFERILETVARHPAPVVASIQGAALGGGFQLATVCDFRIAADDARLGIPAARLGIVVNLENVQRLVLLAGVSVAKEMLMAARTFTGAEAATAGLVTSAVPGQSLEEETRAFAEHLAGLGPLALRGAKRAIGLVAEHLGSARRHLPEEAAEVDRLVAQAYASEDLAEGLAALAAKRPPNFKGR